MKYMMVIVSTVLLTVGFGLIITESSWLVALGLFLAMWGNNLNHNGVTT